MSKASCSVSQAQRVLRELEFKDRLIVDISSDQGCTVVDAIAAVKQARRTGGKVPLIADILSERGKKGGRGKGCTVQYFILDRKIFNIVQQQRWAERDNTRSYEKHTPSYETETRSPQDQYSVMVTDEAVSSNREVRTEKRIDNHDGVRRPYSELRPIDYDSAYRREKLETHLRGKIERLEDSYPAWIETCKQKGWKHPFGDDEQQAFTDIAYTPDLTSPLLTFDFVSAVTIVCEEHRGKGVSPGNLCSKVMDYCERERKRDGERAYYWPPDFQEHRNDLRVEERKLEPIAECTHALASMASSDSSVSQIWPRP